MAQVIARHGARLLAGLLLAALLPACTAGAPVRPAASAAVRPVASAAISPPGQVGAEPLVKSVVIGTSVLGRPIVAVHRWRPGATRTLLVIGNMHGDEQAGLRV